MIPNYNKPNPWKKWPRDLPCFCGSGRTPNQGCPCKIAMPDKITAADAFEAQITMDHLLAHVETLKKQKIIFRDIERSRAMHQGFIDRDRKRELDAKQRAIRAAINKFRVGTGASDHYGSGKAGDADPNEQFSDENSGGDPDRPAS